MQDSCTLSPVPRSRLPLILLAAGFALCILAMPVLAHAPSNVNVVIDKDMGIITVTIAHSSPDPGTHYIDNVKVKLNERVVIDTDYTTQPNMDMFTYIYPVPVNSGDTVRVTARCKLGGSTTGVVTLPTGSATAPPTIPQTTMPVPSPTQKSPSGLIPLAGLLLCAVFALALNRK